MVSNSDPGEGTSDGRHKRKRKPKSKHSKTTIKQENDIKVEPRDGDGTYMVQFSPPTSPIETSGTIKSESETDDELCLKSEPDCVKTEIKSNKDECSMKKCDAAQDGHLNDNSSNHNDGINVANVGGNVNDNDEQRGKKKSGKNKNANHKASIDPAKAKEQKKHKCHMCDYAASFNSQLKKSFSDQASHCN
ncbi:uncharacterized protein LOC116351123 [Contarinia nasturtii]|uniref:uncharacterized protein LOC116351123 n=1 Tax=Contarinia nasturtii TaxID=265458 RepID=UPI0012D49084|nr:uncharacterized protein LOC116351123 [Contarinia nasturtii]